MSGWQIEWPAVKVGYVMDNEHRRLLLILEIERCRDKVLILCCAIHPQPSAHVTQPHNARICTQSSPIEHVGGDLDRPDLDLEWTNWPQSTAQSALCVQWQKNSRNGGHAPGGRVKMHFLGWHFI